MDQGSRPQKKLIAQQVESVFPQAVMRKTGVLPDIDLKSAMKDGWIGLETDLRIGDRVQLVTQAGTTICEVVAVEKDWFRTDPGGDEEKLFVYGQEVDDFRSVDYEAVAMLNVSATQELHRRLVLSEARVKELERQLEKLKSADKLRDEKFASIESLLRSSQAIGRHLLSTEQAAK